MVATLPFVFYIFIKFSKSPSLDDLRDCNFFPRGYLALSLTIPLKYRLFMIKKINEAVAYIQSVYNSKPIVGIVLGSGLGDFGTKSTLKKKLLIKIYLISL